MKVYKENLILYIQQTFKMQNKKKHSSKVRKELNMFNTQDKKEIK